ncbi:ATP-binding cassette domain-containing protein [Candidatus Gracilibacteria bacterium]|nr:ATP-binding cassette domain-containing protein [Candidatus Gracilibacteria bacterium]
MNIIINQNDRMALIGRNGIGKSTLMKIISGQIEEYDGNIDNVGGMTLGYLEQIHFIDENKSIRDELRDAFSEIRKVEKTIELEEKKMSETGDYILYTEAIERYKLIGGYTYENEIERVARGIGIFQLLEKKLSGISGGERTKIALAKILLSKPEFLLLDEPTNFIDLGSVEWLENYLEHTWKGGYLIVSHDREFLDRTCTATIEVLGKNGIKIYHGDYTYSVDEREKLNSIQEKKFEEQQVLIESEKTLINRFRAGSRAGFAKSRERALDKMEILDKVETKIEVNFIFSYDKYSPETILKIEDAFIGRKEPLFYIRSVHISKGEKIGIVGENGVGKSTFIKTILGQMKALEGYVHIHENARVLYFSQLHETLILDKSIYDNFVTHGLPYSRERIGSIISTYGFAFHDTSKKVHNLSGGERSRLLFALLSQNSFAWKQDVYSENSNLLILDEPTNHLDTDTRESLEKALREYPGAILFISHDRYFVNKLAQKIWIIEDGELMISYGNYEDYRYKRERGIDLDMSLFNLDGELDLVLEEKLGIVEARRIKEKFARRRKKK